MLEKWNKGSPVKGDNIPFLKWCQSSSSSRWHPIYFDFVELVPCKVSPTTFVKLRNLKFKIRIGRVILI